MSELRLVNAEPPGQDSSLGCWRSRGRKGGQVVEGMVGSGEDSGFSPREVGALEGCGQRDG